jgi:hypothetical protein
MFAIGLAAIDVGPGRTVDDYVRTLRHDRVLDGCLVAHVESCMIESQGSLTFSGDVGYDSATNQP